MAMAMRRYFVISGGPSVVVVVATVVAAATAAVVLVVVKVSRDVDNKDVFNILITVSYSSTAWIVLGWGTKVLEYN